jgi:DNA polymerase
MMGGVEHMNTESAPESPGQSRQLLDNLLLIEDFLRYGVRSGRRIEAEDGALGFGDSSGNKGNSAEGDRQTRLDAIEARVRQCTACVLSQSRSHTVFGEGVTSPQVLVIGEGPGAEEDRQGLPFVGASGNLLDKMLAAIGLSRRTNCYIGNIVKCRPPNNREPTPTERDACIGYLRVQIEILKPRLILCVGRTAAHSLLEVNDAISRLRGRTFAFEGIPVRVTFHPSALLRDESLKRPAWEDLKQFRTLMDSLTDSPLQPSRNEE